jgi:Xaa-Pro aminopeptidase
METKFSPEFFIGNRARLRQLFTGKAPIVITANGLLQRGADGIYPFEQDANFWYLTGIDEPEIVLILDKDKEYLIVPDRGATREIFDGVIEYDDLIKRSGIQTIYGQKEGWKQVASRLKKAKNVATLSVAPSYIEAHGFYTNPARRVLVRRLKEMNPNLELLDLRPHLVRMRMIKQPQELETIQMAINITLDTLKDISKPHNISKYVNEYEIEADVSRGFRRRGAKGHAFTPIVASGKNACVIHNLSNDGPLSSDELIIVDVGAEVEHYAADITRVLSLSDHISRRQQAVLAAVIEVQDFGFSLLKPGILIREYEQQIEQFMGEKLRELGLIKIIEHDAVRKFFPHATSHFLGLDPHDAGDYERPLEPGVVITVEPGIYIMAEELGIRIEDDVLITENGIKVLSSGLSREIS